MLDRHAALQRLEQSDEQWDVLVVGGGATGLGCALDAAARGYRVALLEQSDFAKATSSRSTKLVHGGVRYLQQGNIALVLDALRERGRLQRNAPHLVHPLPFVIPVKSRWQAFYYGLGMRVYDLLARRLSFGRSRNLSHAQTMQMLPTLAAEPLHGGVLYYDGQFDDARLAINIAQSAAEHGAALVNYCKVTGITHENHRVAGVIAHDLETDRTLHLRARVVINATGVYADQLRQLDDAHAASMIRPSQGAHIVLDRRFLPGDAALMVPRTDDGRVLFAIPWHDKVIIGTTDTPVNDTPLEPHAQPPELEFLFEHAGRYLTQTPEPSDALSTFTGLRPLVAPPNAAGATAKIARDHSITVSDSGLITIAGGKWTTYRKMAQDTIDRAIAVAGLKHAPCTTAELALHGAGADAPGPLGIYGSDADAIQQLIDSNAALAQPIHPRLPHVAGEVLWHVRYEAARTVDDVLARRTRALILDARAASEAAPTVAQLIADELGRDEHWQQEQVNTFRQLASHYMVQT